MEDLVQELKSLVFQVGGLVHVDCELREHGVVVNDIRAPDGLSETRLDNTLKEIAGRSDVHFAKIWLSESVGQTLTAWNIDPEVYGFKPKGTRYQRKPVRLAPGTIVYVMEPNSSIYLRSRAANCKSVRKVLVDNFESWNGLIDLETGLQHMRDWLKVVSNEFLNLAKESSRELPHFVHSDRAYTNYRILGMDANLPLAKCESAFVLAVTGTGMLEDRICNLAVELSEDRKSVV